MGRIFYTEKRNHTLMFFVAVLVFLDCKNMIVWLPTAREPLLTKLLACFCFRFCRLVYCIVSVCCYCLGVICSTLQNSSPLHLSHGSSMCNLVPRAFPFLEKPWERGWSMCMLAGSEYFWRLYKVAKFHHHGNILEYTRSSRPQPRHPALEECHPEKSSHV